MHEFKNKWTYGHYETTTTKTKNYKTNKKANKKLKKNPENHPPSPTSSSDRVFLFR